MLNEEAFELWKQRASPLNFPKWKEIAFIPEHAIIPDLQRLRDARYKFHTTLVKWFRYAGAEAGNDYAIKALVLSYGSTCVTLFDPDNLPPDDFEPFVVTMTKNKNIYKAPLPKRYMPLRLGDYTYDEETSLDLYKFIKAYFSLDVAFGEQELKQGHLELVEILPPHATKVLMWEIPSDNNKRFFNHELEGDYNTAMYMLPLNLIIVRAGENARFVSTDHAPLELKPNTWYLGYHPTPTRGAD